MATGDRRTVVGVFSDQRSAQQAVAELKRIGFRDDQIGVVASGGEGAAATDEPAPDRATNSKIAEGAGIGAATGAGVGALWALGMMAGVLPAIGPIIAGGWLMSIIASAGGAATAGTILGALVGLGVPEEDAKYYESEFSSGRTLVTVKADNRYDEVWAIMHRFGAYNRENAGGTGSAAATAHTATHATGTAGTARHAEGGQTVQVREEQLRAQKRAVEAGEVRVRKEVVTEQQTLQVPVTREEVVIERHAAGGKPASGDIRPGEEVRIPVREEQVSIEKRPVVTEEVTVGKRTVQETQQVSGDVKKEKVHVEREGDVDVRGNAGDNKNRK